LLLGNPGVGLPFQQPPLSVPGAHAHGNGNSDKMGTELQGHGHKWRARWKRGSGMFVARPVVATGAGAERGGHGGSNSRPSAPLGHEGGVRPVPKPPARCKDEGQGRFRGRRSLNLRPSASLGHEGVVRLGHGGGGRWARGRPGGCEKRVWCVGQLKCAFFRKFSLAAGEEIGSLRVFGEKQGRAVVGPLRGPPPRAFFGTGQVRGRGAQGGWWGSGWK